MWARRLVHPSSPKRRRHEDCIPCEETGFTLSPPPSPSRLTNEHALGEPRRRRWGEGEISDLLCLRAPCRQLSLELGEMHGARVQRSGHGSGARRGRVGCFYQIKILAKMTIDEARPGAHGAMRTAHGARDVTQVATHKKIGQSE